MLDLFGGAAGGSSRSLLELENLLPMRLLILGRSVVGLRAPGG